MTTDKLYSHLYEKPIEELELSVLAINKLKRTGILYIGDIVDFFNMITNIPTIGVTASFIEVMFGEVKDQLINKGYCILSTTSKFTCAKKPHYDLWGLYLENIGVAVATP